MRAVIMAGGEGSRLRPLTSNQPKPLMPIANRPMMEHVIDLLRRHGITDIVSSGLPPGVEPAWMAANIERLATEVLPEVRVRHDGDGPRVACSIDAQLLHRAVLNLMRNALDAIGPKGTVSLFQQADADAQALRIEVVDDGPGMAPATLERARERGFSTRGVGRGLGLAFVDSFAASVGGTLTIESEEGIGTRVSLRVPAHPIAD